MRTIRATGKGNLKVRPDTTHLMFTLNGVSPEYSEAINRSTAETEALRELLLKAGFKSTAMKTLSFDVDRGKTVREVGPVKESFLNNTTTN